MGPDKTAYTMVRSLPGDRLGAELSMAGFTLSPRDPVSEEPAFYDTQDGKLYKASCRLCFDRVGKTWAAEGGPDPKTWKYRSASQAVLRKIEEDLSSLLRGRRLLCHLNAKMDEKRFTVTSSTGAVMSLSFTTWSFSRPHTRGWTDPVQSIAIEGTKTGGEIVFLKTILGDLGLIGDTRFDPLCSGLETVNAPLPGAPVPRELEIGPGDTIGGAGDKVLARQAYKMWANKVGTAYDEDPEFLHDLRVATRRARFALKLLRPAFGKTYCNKMREELSWVAGVLGAVRDIDVFLPYIEPHFDRAETDEEIRRVFEHELETRRNRALGEMKKALRTKRFEYIIEGMRDRGVGISPKNPVEAGGDTAGNGGKALSDGPGFTEETPAGTLAPVFIFRGLNRIEKWRKQRGKNPASEDYHRLRILFKGIRYTCEFFEGLYEGKLNNPIRVMVQFQDCLGQYQDAQVAVDTLRSILDALPLGEKENTELAIATGSLIQVQREIAREKLSEFRRLWKKFNGLRKMLEEVLG